MPSWGWGDGLPGVMGRRGNPSGTQGSPSAHVEVLLPFGEFLSKRIPACATWEETWVPPSSFGRTKDLHVARLATLQTLAGLRGLRKGLSSPSSGTLVPARGPRPVALDTIRHYFSGCALARSTPGNQAPAGATRRAEQHPARVYGHILGSAVTPPWRGRWAGLPWEGQPRRGTVVTL